MKAGGGKAKGGNYERWVAKTLSEWATGAKGEEVFWRTAGSGSRGTVSGATHQLGDIGSIAPAGNALTASCIVECKFYKCLSWDKFLIEGTGTLDKFWIDLQMCALTHRKVPLLIAKENLRTTLVVTVREALLVEPLLTRSRGGIQAGVLTLDAFLRQQYSEFTAHTARLTHTLYAPPPDSRPASNVTPRTRLQVKVPRVARVPVRVR
jgi:hypothetical protein